MVELERELSALGSLLNVPDAPGLVADVRARLVPRTLRVRPVLVAAVAAVLVAVGSLNTPVVADWLRAGGVELRREAPPTAPAPPDDGGVLRLGDRSTLRGAQAAADFALVTPAALGPPDEVWLQRAGGTTVVWFAYRPVPGLPEAASTGYGALFAQSRLQVADNLLATKFVEPGTRLTPVKLGTGPAYWVEGVHFIGLRRASGEVVVDELRLADNVLLWERGAITLRFESALALDDALRIARSAV